MKITIEMPTHDQLPPTKEEKWQALREKVEELMEMAEVGHNERYCLKCLNVVYRKLKAMPNQKPYTQDLAKRIHSFILQHTGDQPK